MNVMGLLFVYYWLFVVDLFGLLGLYYFLQVMGCVLWVVLRRMVVVCV